MKSDSALAGLTLAERRELLKMARVRDLVRGGAELPPVAPAPRDGPVPLSFTQQRLWFMERLGGLGSTYHLPTRMRLRGALDREALARALDRVVERHEALRTTFAEVDGVPEQRIAPARSSRFHLAENDLGGVPDAEAWLARRAAEEARAPFDLERGPLIRGRLIRVAGDDHVLLLTMHHIVGDLWSLGVLTRELSTLYAAFRRGEPDPLPPLPVQFADYALWQRRWVQGEVLREQVDYWTRTLSGAPELLEIPTDHPRPPRQDHAGGRVRVVLDEALTAAVKALSRRHGTTPYITLLAGWAAVLSRLSGQDDVVIGTLSAGRGRQEIEGLIGYFVNTLALRVDLSGAPTVAELLARVKERALEAQQHQDVPFEQIVERIDPVRSLSHSPVFQVLFTWQSTARGDGPALPGLEADGVGAESSDVRAKTDLYVSLRESAGRIVGSVTYAAAIFERETVERHVAYLRRALEEMAADDLRPVERLDILPPAERRRVVVEWSTATAPYPQDACIHELFEAQARRTPHAAAVAMGGRELTYDQLNRRANRLVPRLREIGVGPDRRVAICLERGPEIVIALLAVLKAGGAYVPLDPAYPADRLRYMAGDCAPCAVIAGPALAETFAEGGVPVLELGAGGEAAWASEAEENPGRGELGPRHLAYLIYTSGSTGRPKGVMIEHHSLVNAFLAYVEPYELATRSRRHLQMASFSFDVFTGDWTRALCTGGTLVLCPREALLDPARLYALLEEERIDVAEFVPAVLRELVRHAEETGRTLGFMKVVVCSSDTWSVAEYRRFLGVCGPETRLINSFGITEATIDSTWFEAAALDGLRGDQHVPIGRPLANTTIRVLDPARQPSPVGVAGELYIGGPNVARGYHDRPELSAEKFVADPFGRDPGARLYRTGDAARWRPDGVLEFLGRIDSQVKIRGFRVELGEVEARLGEHPAVRAAAAATREDAPGDRRLVAYYVADGAPEPQALRAWMAERLPEHMLPSAFVRLDAMPLTPNGKVNRRALPAPQGAAVVARAFEEPVGETETALAAIWAEVLRVERVGRHDGFFALGGHSLLAVRVISRLRQALGVEVALGQVFTRPTLAEFAREVEAAARSHLPPIEPAPREGRIPLSFAQQRLWLLERLGGLGSTYHLPVRLRLRGGLDRAALSRALGRIVERHEALRTTFAQTDGVPEQRIAPADVGFLPREHDLAGEADARGALARLAAEEGRALFDLERGPLIRGRLVRLAEDDHVLLLTLHHIISDGWSMGVLTDELSALYGAFRRGEPDPLPPLPVQYADYAAWQRRWMEGGALREQAEYWTRTLAEAPQLLELPTDHPRPAEQDRAAARLLVVLDEELTAGVKALARRHGATPFMAVLAGWAAVLARLSGQDDVVIGTPTAGRGRREIEGLIGFFVNTLALRVDLSGDPSAAELLGRVRERALEAQHHQDIPFEQVVELVDPTRSLSHDPVFQVMLAWQDTLREGAVTLPGLELGGVGAVSRGDAGVERVDAKYDLALELSERDGRIRGIATYATSLFERATVERWIGYLRRVLEEMAADDSRPVERLSLLSADERRLVVEEWNRTGAAYPAESSIHGLFEARAERAPDAVAVEFAGEHLTYAELNRRANRLAHHLRSLGVDAESRVAIALERGPELIAAMLGVLKAGGAYVPLDPGYPAERLRFMLEDSRAAVLLTRRDLALDLDPSSDRARPVWLDEAAEAIADEPDANPGVECAPAQLCYVVYTSGSTGRPKGVAAEHHEVVHLVRDTDYVSFGPGDRVAQASNASFDALTFEAWGALLGGATLVGIPRDVLLTPAAFRRVLREERITTLYQTTALLNLLSREQPDIFATLREVLFGGQAVEVESVRRVLKGGGPRRLVHVYGPTEVMAWCSWEEVREVAEGARTVSVGRPIARMRMYVLDRNLEPVPLGAAGEIYVGGAGVARGYLGRSELTAERFVADPFAAEPGARLYRTGDLGRWRADGTLEFAGRNDEQVKIRGFRIEPGEIEARLAAHPDVREAVVLAREDTPGDQRLVAYWTPADASWPVESEELRSYLSTALPEYMVPAAYVLLDALPLTPTGKLDRRALPAPEGESYGRPGYEAPVGEVEQALAEIWAEALKVERVGRGDNFFELGGHSLLAVRVLERMRGRGLHADTRELFAAPTLADLAKEVGGASRQVEVPVSPLARLEPSAREPDPGNVEWRI